MLGVGSIINQLVDVTINYPNRKKTKPWKFDSLTRVRLEDQKNIIRPSITFHIKVKIEGYLLWTLGFAHTEFDSK